MSGMERITRIDVIDNSVPGKVTIAFHDENCKDRRVLAAWFPGGYRFEPQYLDGARWYNCHSGSEMLWCEDLGDAMEITRFDMGEGKAS